MRTWDVSAAPPAQQFDRWRDVICEVFVPLAGMIDLGAERARLSKEIGQKEAFLRGVEGKLGNEGFVARAPADVIARERQKADDARADDHDPVHHVQFPSLRRHDPDQVRRSGPLARSPLSPAVRAPV